MLSREEIRDIVCDVVMKIMGLPELDENTCIIERDVCTNPVDFLYIFEELEMKLGVTLEKILIEHTYEVFIIKNFVNAIFDEYYRCNEKK